MAGFDAIVVGGGVVGLSTAWHLVEAGARTLLVDAGHAGRATDAGAGILSARPISPPRTRTSASRAGGRLLPAADRAARREGAGDTGYAVCGSLTVAVSDDEVARVRAAARAACAAQVRRRMAIPSSRPSRRARCSRRWPPCRARSIARATRGSTAAFWRRRSARRRSPTDSRSARPRSRISRSRRAPCAASSSTARPCRQATS